MAQLFPIWRILVLCVVRLCSGQREARELLPLATDDWRRGRRERESQAMVVWQREIGTLGQRSNGEEREHFRNLEITQNI